MKFHILFSGKNEKNINWLSAELAQRVVKDLLMVIRFIDYSFRKQTLYNQGSITFEDGPLLKWSSQITIVSQPSVYLFLTLSIFCSSR